MPCWIEMVFQITRPPRWRISDLSGRSGGGSYIYIGRWAAVVPHLFSRLQRPGWRWTDKGSDEGLLLKLPKRGSSRARA